MKKAATAFASQRTNTGQSLGWELILGATVPVDFATAFPLNIRNVGAFNTRAVALVPSNVTRGTLTMMRVRGTIFVYFSSAELAVAFANWPVHIQLQMVPARDGVINQGAVLSPQNSADQESNRIIWQRLYMPRAGTTITGEGAVELHESSAVALEVDVKVKRRWDRADWALALVSEVETGSVVLHQFGGYLRGLFATGDGL